MNRFLDEIYVRTIVTITLNPALDISTKVDRVVAGPKLRCGVPTIDPGGGGINVSRVVAEMGGTSTAFVALGGATGKGLLQALDEAHLEIVTFPITGETRQSLSVVSTETEEQFRFIMPGPEWSCAMVEDVLYRIAEVCPKGAFVVVSGSLPLGVPADFAERLCQALPDRDLVLDLSGEALERVAKDANDVFLLRMDRAEGEVLHGGPLASAKDTADFARHLVTRHAAQRVIIARGSEGSVLADASGAWAVKAADTKVLSATGAGDSFVGAMVYGLAKDLPLCEALQIGAAAASATVTTAATELCHRKMVYELLPQCEVREV